MLTWPLVVCAVHGAFAEPPSHAGANVVCIPDRPIAHTGEEIDVSAFALVPDGSRPQFAWTATAGQIRGEGSKASWNLQNVLSGVYSSTVTVTSGGQPLGDCNVEVTVVEPERSAPEEGVSGTPRTTARTFLATDMKEESGFGLYSYLLFGSPPTESTRPRYLKAIQACLTMIPTVAELRKYRPATRLNAMYVPVKTRPTGEPAAEWVLTNYDFARARVLLDALSPRYQTGPYMVSALTPLSNLQPVPQEHLFQDMSLVPAEPDDLLTWWVRAFLNQAAQEQFWKPETGELLTLKLRTMLSVEAAALPEVKRQLASWIAWTK